VAFHIFSWPIVGFWYPTLMFCLLSILPLMCVLSEILARRLQPRDTVNWPPRRGTGGETRPCWRRSGYSRWCLTRFLVTRR
jgi:hypothetical protein